MEKNIEGLQKIAEELERQMTTKKDYIVDTNNIITIYDPHLKEYKIDIIDTEKEICEITDNCHTQIGTKLKIPKSYYDYLKQDHPELLIKNINELMQTQNKKMMIRTLDNKARAFLSNKYRPIDNYDVFYKTLEELKQLQTTGMNIEIKQSKLTERGLYIKAISKDLTDTVYGNKDPEKGDIVHGGIIISNSETGQGSYKVMPFINVVICNNGMISDKIFKRIHIGKEIEEGTINWSEQTESIENELLWSKLTDMIHNTFNKQTFTEWINEINKVASEYITTPTKAIDTIIKNFPQITQDKKDELLTRFAEYGYTKWGLCQAVTTIAQNQENYETQLEYERIGPKILEYPGLTS